MLKLTINLLQNFLFDFYLLNVLQTQLKRNYCKHADTTIKNVKATLVLGLYEERAKNSFDLRMIEKLKKNSLKF